MTTPCRAIVGMLQLQLRLVPDLVEDPYLSCRARYPVGPVCSKSSLDDF